MEYQTGSYIITARKEHICKECGEKISPKNYYFARVKISEDKNIKIYKRYHIDCAISFLNLNEYEKSLFIPECNQKIQVAIDEYSHQLKRANTPFDIIEKNCNIVTDFLQRGLL
jgi:hypothetical protein